MFVATAIVSVLLAALLALSAGIKFARREPFVQTYAKVGVPDDKLNYLAVILLVGAGGLLLGLMWAPIGIAAAIGLIGYFVAAVVFHIRANDTKNLASPLLLTALAVAALVLRLGTL